MLATLAVAAALIGHTGGPTTFVHQTTLRPQPGSPQLGRATRLVERFGTQVAAVTRDGVLRLSQGRLRVGNALTLAWLTPRRLLVLSCDDACVVRAVDPARARVVRRTPVDLRAPQTSIVDGRLILLEAQTALVVDPGGRVAHTIEFPGPRVAQLNGDLVLTQDAVHDIDALAGGVRSQPLDGTEMSWFGAGRERPVVLDGDELRRLDPETLALDRPFFTIDTTIDNYLPTPRGLLEKHADRLIAYGANGAQRWRKRFPFTFNAAAIGDRVYVQDTRNRVRVLDLGSGRVLARSTLRFLAPVARGRRVDRLPGLCGC